MRQHMSSQQTFVKRNSSKVSPSAVFSVLVDEKYTTLSNFSPLEIFRPLTSFGNIYTYLPKHSHITHLTGIIILLYIISSVYILFFNQFLFLLDIFKYIKKVITYEIL